jgi:Rrf2 family protein
MLGYGKMSACAVAAMSLLAEKYHQGEALNSLHIATARNLSQPLVAKILTTLSRAGYVTGTRGHGGGYRLKKSPSEITIFEVVNLFEGHRDTFACPFGPGWCMEKNPCPLHYTLFALRDNAEEKLSQNTFAIFCPPDAKANHPSDMD